MANSAQAIKRDRQSKKRNALRSAQRSQTRTAVKDTRKALVAGAANATDVFKRAVKTLDRMADKSVIHKNKAARLKSRLARQLKAAATAAQA
ncbi:30S ribosomal protein S20 [Chitinasiproducens palmae]|uniref:Small ribosomal subunit protein bS20 n=1 Tax=Chitinasiproducens palmae TaxID=1770053 RepID=A0A1H2PRB7_9BURK|nr:30S ribosomal protein S20 [Chitinasiproducens palmae]SDV49432.1 SSU ribosomal protein S20P [Chitinasiproducens palmae]